ncbi:MAG: peptidylprolyl isomerase [Thermoanaerobaculia bacterium]
MSGRTLLRVGALLGTTLVLTACSPPREERDPLLATFAGGEVRQSDLDTWRSFLNAQGRDGHWLGLDALERHVVMRTLAGEAIDAGLDEEPAVRIRVRRAVDERLAVLLRADVARSIEIPADLVEGYLEEHRDELDKPERRTVRFIFRRSSEDDPDRARLELQEARRRLLAGEDFAAVAAEVSESPSRLRGGLLGTIPRGKPPEQVDRILFSSRKGR